MATGVLGVEARRLEGRWCSEFLARELGMVGRGRTFVGEGLRGLGDGLDELRVVALVKASLLLGDDSAASDLNGGVGGGLGRLLFEVALDGDDHVVLAGAFGTKGAHDDLHLEGGLGDGLFELGDARAALEDYDTVDEARALLGLVAMERSVVLDDLVDETVALVLGLAEEDLAVSLDLIPVATSTGDCPRGREQTPERAQRREE